MLLMFHSLLLSTILYLQCAERDAGQPMKIVTRHRHFEVTNTSPATARLASLENIRWFQRNQSLASGKGWPIDGECSVGLEPCMHRGLYTRDYCGMPKDTMSDWPRLLKIEEAIEKGIEDGGICSQFYQDVVLASIFKSIGTTNKYFVEFGSRRPEILNSAHFRLNCDWHGLLMDGAPGASPNGGSPDYAGIAELMKSSDTAPVRLRQAFITRYNINDLLLRMQVPASIDLLTIDIDRNDYWVMLGWDTSRIRPRVVAIEFSSFFSSREPAVPRYKPNAVWQPPEVTGSSLAALNQLMRAKGSTRNVKIGNRGRGYEYVTQVAGEHAVWVLSSELQAADRSKRIPDEVHEGWQHQKRVDLGGALSNGETLEDMMRSRYQFVSPPCDQLGCLP